MLSFFNMKIKIFVENAENSLFFLEFEYFFKTSIS